MTAIAVFKVDTVPIVIGDVLISTEGNPKPEFKLPGSGESGVDHVQWNTPVSLAQKVIKISEKLIIAWTGPLLVARIFVRELREKIADAESVSWQMTEEIFNKFIDEECQSKLGKEFGFVALYKDDKIVVTTGHNVEPVEVEGYEGLLVGGTGSHWIIENLKDVNFRIDNDLPNGQKAPHKVMSLLSRLWTFDITHQGNIKFGFGGGYEIGTSFDNRGLDKVSDYILSHAYSKPDQGGMIGFNRTFAKFDYLDDVLMLRILRLDNDGKEAEVTTSSQLSVPKVEKSGFIIPPIDMNSTSVNELNLKSLPDMNAEFTALLLEIVAENGKHMTTSFTYWRPQRNGPINISEKDIFYEPEIFQGMIEESQTFQSNNTN